MLFISREKVTLTRVSQYPCETGQKQWEKKSKSAMKSPGHEEWPWKNLSSWPRCRPGAGGSWKELGLCHKPWALDQCTMQATASGGGRGGEGSLGYEAKRHLWGVEGDSATSLGLSISARHKRRRLGEEEEEEALAMKRKGTFEASRETPASKNKPSRVKPLLQVKRTWEDIWRMNNSQIENHRNTPWFLI